MAAPVTGVLATGGTFPPVSVWRAALLCRCPRCGQGGLFQGLLAVRPACPVCGLDLAAQDAGDGAAVGAIFLLGTVFTVAAFWVEFRFNPPLWLHAVLWPVLMLPASLLVMRPAKAALIALQWRHHQASLDA